VNRFAILVAAVGLFAAAPVILARLEDVPPRWRLRLGAISLFGLTSAFASLFAAVLLPEVLTVRSIRELWSTCNRAFHTLGGDPLGRWPSLLAGAALALILGRLAWALVLAARATMRARVRAAEPRWVLAGRHPVYVLPLDRAEAYSVGCWRSHVVVSQGMIEMLDRDERAAVLLHEEGHLKGRHHLILVLARAVARALWPLPAAPGLLTLIEQAIEEAADEYAARGIGNAAVVAGGVAKAALAELGGPAGALPAGGPDVPARIRRLLNPSEVPSWMPYACLAGVVVLLGVFAVTQAIAGLALVAAAHHVFGVGAAMACPLTRRS